METAPRVLLIHEVAALLRVSIPTVNRWVRLRRKGEGEFPLPISAKGGKGRWLASDVEKFLALQSNVASSVNLASPVKRRQQAKTHQQRKEAARAALARHTTNSSIGELAKIAMDD